MYEDAILYSCETDSSELARFWSCLYDFQTENEKKDGESIERNGVGLTCFEARVVARRGDSGTDATTKLRFVKNHLSQLSRAVEKGDTDPPRHERPRGGDMRQFFERWDAVPKRITRKRMIGNTRRRRRQRVRTTRRIDESEDDESSSLDVVSDSKEYETESELEFEKGTDTKIPESSLTVTAAGLYHESSRTIVAFNQRAHETVIGTALESDGFEEALRAVREKLEWAFPVTANDLDAALFQELRTKKVEEGTSVRIFWEDANSWIGAKVVRKDANARKLELRFDDGKEGFASMHDAEMVYANPWK